MGGRDQMLSPSGGTSKPSVVCQHRLFEIQQIIKENIRRHFENIGSSFPVFVQ